MPTTAVRYGGIIHDFVMLNALHDTHAAKAAIRQAVGFLRSALHDEADDLSGLPRLTSPTGTTIGIQPALATPRSGPPIASAREAPSL